MHHTDKRRISAWLKDLREKHYIAWIYQPDDPTESKTPAIYYLALNGIRYLREHENYPLEALRKRYTESSRKRSFVDRCLLLADCCIDAGNRSVGDIRFTCILQADYANEDSDYSFLEDLQPHACFVKEEETEDGVIVTNYLLDIFITTTPQHRIKKRIRAYVAYLNKASWEDATDDDKPPIIELAFATKADLIYAKRRARLELADIYGDSDDDIPEDIQMQFTTVEKIRENGVTARIWEKLM